MVKFFRYFCFCFCLAGDGYTATLDNYKQNFTKMSCSELMIGLIRESSFNKKFQDKNLALEFYFERHNARDIGLKFVQRAGDDKDGIYANFNLDLLDSTLKIIDPEQPIPIKINKDYIPFIAEKCTPDQNLYGNTGRLPEPGES